ncbi:MAG: hypothetical protein RLY43_400 [Bacteroidota bacterium]|jgi:hypothetical protein
MIVDYNCLAVYNAKKQEAKLTCGPFSFAIQLSKKYHFELKVTEDNEGSIQCFYLEFKDNKHGEYFLLKFG